MIYVCMLLSSVRSPLYRLTEDSHPQVHVRVRVRAPSDNAVHTIINRVPDFYEKMENIITNAADYWTCTTLGCRSMRKDRQL